MPALAYILDIYSHCWLDIPEVICQRWPDILEVYGQRLLEYKMYQASAGFIRLLEYATPVMAYISDI
jgi:hypothetical protein